MRADLAIDALEMAIFNRQCSGSDLSQLTHHIDRGMQAGCNRSLQRRGQTNIVKVERGRTRLLRHTPAAFETNHCGQTVPAELATRQPASFWEPGAEALASTPID